MLEDKKEDKRVRKNIRKNRTFALNDINDDTYSKNLQIFDITCF